MLKFDLLLLFALTLLNDDDFYKLVSCIIGFFAGMSWFIAAELKDKTLSKVRVVIRLLYAFGAVFAGVTLQSTFFPNWNTAIVVAACTFFSESIVAIASVGFVKYLKNISGVKDELKDDANV